MPTRVAAYIRVSTEDQAKEGFSLPAQRGRLEAFCQAQGWDLVKVYEDDGFTGRDTDRPAYQRMLRERNQWDAILVLKMDRIHRNSRNFMAMMDDLGRWEREFVSATEALDTSNAMGRFVMDIIQRIAQLESEQIGERTVVGMDEAKKQEVHVGRPPVGFEWDGDETKFRPSLWGAAVRRDAEEHGIAEAGRRNPYPDGKKKGKRVSKTAVRRVLENFRLYGDGRLVPNRQRSEPGTWAKK